MNSFDHNGVDRRTALAAIAAMGALGSSTVCAATAVPKGADLSGTPIRLIVPYTPGGSSDIIARAM